MALRRFTPDQERDIVARLHAGDVRALELVFYTYYDPLVAFAESVVRDRDAARDVVSEVIIGFWNSRDRFTVTTSLHAFLYRSVRNRALNHHRSYARRSARYEALLATEDLPGIGEVAQPDGDPIPDAFDTLWDAVATLTDRAKSVVTLRWRAQMTHAEIAETLGVSEEAVKKTHQRALLALARLIPNWIRETD